MTANKTLSDSSWRAISSLRRWLLLRILCFPEQRCLLLYCCSTFHGHVPRRARCWRHLIRHNVVPPRFGSGGGGFIKRARFYTHRVHGKTVRRRRVFFCVDFIKVD